VRLEEDGAGTRLNYTVEAHVGGKLAQIGSRLIDATSRKMAEEFFTRFSAAVGGPPATEAAPAPLAANAVAPPAEAASAPTPASAGPAAMAAAATAPPAASRRLSPVVWVPLLAVAVGVLLYVFTRS
jgi:uncharacterized protein